LNPDLKKVAWTEKEEILIVQMRANLGNRWAKIARALPGRSDNDVKNRWYGKKNHQQQQKSFFFISSFFVKLTFDSLFLVWFLFLASLRKRVDEDGDPSILLPKKKRAKDKKKNNKKNNKTTSKRKRKLCKFFSARNN
jgi:hypothetical protein